MSLQRTIKRNILKREGKLKKQHSRHSKGHKYSRGFRKTPLLSTVYKHLYDVYRYVRNGYHKVDDKKLRPRGKSLLAKALRG